MKIKYQLLLGLSVLSLASGALFFSRSHASTQSLVPITIYKTPTCVCCEQWGQHLKENGFEVTIVKKVDFFEFKKQFRVPKHVESCHVGVVGNQFFEGHIPASAIHEFLKSKTQDRGLAVPGMPLGSPGMPDHGQPQDYTIYRITPENTAEVFRHVKGRLGR